ncbi:zinc finger, RING/FYVE/PHD-type, acyl-CoA N-acyltransferase, Jas TPL-binding domain protein [Tanacetum coccineum]
MMGLWRLLVSTGKEKKCVNGKASTSQPKENKEAASQSNVFSALEEDNGNPMDDLVDETWKNVKVPLKKTPRKTGIWSGRKADSPKRNVVFSPEMKVHYFDRDDMEFDDMEGGSKINKFKKSKKKSESFSNFDHVAGSRKIQIRGRILDCQTQLQLESVLPADDDKSTKSSDYVTDTNDDYCSFCDDGDLWFCPACVCQICHQGQPSNLTKEGDSKDKDLIKCAQCEHHFHISCINKLGFQVCADYAKWLCTEHCERIYLGLTEIRGKVIPLKGNNLNWSLLKYDENDTDVYELTKSYSKLIKALDVMHECFIPMKHPLSDKDIIEDVIFSRATKRSNFEGFYTAVLEKNDEIITVVTLRIHGYKVAEIPFVATTFSYQRLGMCRILMDVVERMIRGLGVERIVLPR